MKLVKFTHSYKDFYVDVARVVAVWEQDDSDNGGSANQVYIGILSDVYFPVDDTMDNVVSILRYHNSRA